ncbi:hypothetical protein [Pelomonas sp. SE-A7]|uniref:hypothetical protein n=1 Tax=Pelomonas sp. SE-A7 TaxID=3054953 RepID=UPI00259CD8E7|nr:hypothetical protein [Pelomonas sp. SE-A7]MDM4768556.1 hypothetical protein [Pelomonas sp. SE-A7]
MLKTRTWQVFARCACCLPLIFLASGCWEGQATRTAKEKLSVRLVDPQSVQFRNVVEYDGGVVCGEYNAKNRMGGYAGFEEFVFNGPKAAEFSFKPGFTEKSIWCKAGSIEAKRTQQNEAEKAAASTLAP